MSCNYIFNNFKHTLIYSRTQRYYKKKLQTLGTNKASQVVVLNEDM